MAYYDDAEDYVDILRPGDLGYYSSREEEEEARQEAIRKFKSMYAAFVKERAAASHPERESGQRRRRRGRQRRAMDRARAARGARGGPRRRDERKMQGDVDRGVIVAVEFLEPALLVAGIPTPDDESDLANGRTPLVLRDFFSTIVENDNDDLEDNSYDFLRNAYQIYWEFRNETVNPLRTTARLPNQPLGYSIELFMDVKKQRKGKRVYVDGRNDYRTEQAWQFRKGPVPIDFESDGTNDGNVGVRPTQTFLNDRTWRPFQPYSDTKELCVQIEPRDELVGPQEGDPLVLAKCRMKMGQQRRLQTWLYCFEFASGSPCDAEEVDDLPRFELEVEFQGETDFTYYSPLVKNPEEIQGTGTNSNTGRIDPCVGLETEDMNSNTGDRNNEGDCPRQNDSSDNPCCGLPPDDLERLNDNERGCDDREQDVFENENEDALVRHAELWSPDLNRVRFTSLCDTDDADDLDIDTLLRVFRVSYENDDPTGEPVERYDCLETILLTCTAENREETSTEDLTRINDSQNYLMVVTTSDEVSDECDPADLFDCF